jgi:hypothetical protein
MSWKYWVCHRIRITPLNTLTESGILQQKTIYGEMKTFSLKKLIFFENFSCGLRCFLFIYFFCDSEYSPKMSLKEKKFSSRTNQKATRV